MILSLLLTAALARAVDFTTPTRALAVKDFPHFHDDQQLRDLETAIHRQLQRFEQKSLKGTIRFGTHRYPLKQVPASLKEFAAYIADFHTCVGLVTSSTSCEDALNIKLRQHFSVYVPDLKPGDPRYGKDSNAFFTVYDTHTIEGQNHASGDFVYPVFAFPTRSADLNLTRDQIDFHGALAGRGLELAYGNSLFETYMMQIEGSGYVQLPDGTGYYLSYAGANKQKWGWISKYMLAKGYIGNLSTAAQRKFLRLHPELQESIFASCPSYVFFKPSTTPPAGSDLVPLTDGRSLATDHKLYGFKGVLTYVEAQRPEETGHYDFEQEDASQVKFIPFSRFFLDQDTGGAINGKGRADLYFGVGTYAEFAASYSAQNGKIYFMMLNR